MSRLRIGLVIGQLHRGGAESQLVEIAVGLKRDHDLEPVVYCLSSVIDPHGPRLRQSDVTVNVLSRRGVNRVTRPWLLRRSLARDGIDLVNAHLLDSMVHAALATVGTRIPYVFTYWSAYQERPPFRRQVESRAIGLAEVVTANSHAGAEFAHSCYGVPRDKLRVIPSGVKVIPLPDRSAARRELDLSQDARVMLGLFRLSPEKELDLFCRVVEQSLSDSSRAICLIAGDGPLRDWLEARVRRSTHPQCFRILGPSDEVPTLLAATDLMLLTSNREGTPSSVLEAMAAALPVVATQVGDLPHLVEHGESGFVLPAGDEAGLVRACREILHSPELRHRMGARALVRARTRYGIEKAVASYAQLYRSLLTPPDTGSAAAGR